MSWCVGGGVCGRVVVGCVCSGGSGSVVPCSVLVAVMVGNGGAGGWWKRCFSYCC